VSKHEAPFGSWRLCLPIGVLLALALTTPIRASVAASGVLCESLQQNSTSCGSTVRTVTKNKIEKLNPKFPVVNIDDWRREQKIPWSVPVIVKDPFDGKYLAVFDRNYSSSFLGSADESGVITNWSRNYIRTAIYETRQDCNELYYRFYYSGCLGGTQTITAAAKTLEIKLGTQIFQLKGKDGDFPVDKKLAIALRDAPPGKAIIRITLEGSGAKIVSDIGAKTVKAWKIVYQDTT